MALLTMDDTLRMVEWYIAGMFALGGIALFFWVGIWYRRVRGFLARRAEARARHSNVVATQKRHAATLVRW